MRRILLAAAAVLVLGVCAQAAMYKIDPSHSQVMFKVKHLGISTVTGQFEKFEGAIGFDPKNVGASTAEAVIDVASINTKIAKRDEHLRSADFFYADTFPTMTFKSGRVGLEDEDEDDVAADKDADANPSEFIVSGDLNLHGVTRRVDLMVQYTGSVMDPWGSERVAFVAEAEINRKDYGLTWSKLLESGGLVVGEEVWIVIEIEAVHEKEPEKQEEKK